LGLDNQSKLIPQITNKDFLDSDIVLLGS